MPLLYCTAADVNAILSPLGTTLHVEDDGVDELTPEAVANLNEMISWASATIDWFLLERYPEESLANNRWVKHTTATLAACDVMHRRGDPGPVSLNAKCEELTSIHPPGVLELIRRGQADLPNGLPRHDESPALTNYRLDSRFLRQKIRVQETQSTGGPSDIPRATDPLDRVTGVE